MYEKFGNSLTITHRQDGSTRPWLPKQLADVKDYPPFAEAFSGCTFNDGLYRIHNEESGREAVEQILELFPKAAPYVTPFAFDWQGRHFALTKGRRWGPSPMVIILEAGSAEMLHVQMSFKDFHDAEIPSDPQAALLSGFYQDWRELTRSTPLAFNECVGYKRPLFVGGEDDLGNLEITPMSVYWSLCAQLYEQVSKSPGSPIRSISISDD